MPQEAVMKLMCVFGKMRALLNGGSTPEDRRQAEKAFSCCVAVSAFLGVLLLAKAVILALLAGLVLGGLAWFFCRRK